LLDYVVVLAVVKFMRLSRRGFTEGYLATPWAARTYVLQYPMQDAMLYGGTGCALC